MPVKPIVAVTMGDPGGVGPEIAVKALARRRVHRVCRPLIVGDISIVQHAASLLEMDLEIAECASVSELKPRHGRLDVLSVHEPNPPALTPGKVTPEAGQASLDYLQRAVELGEAGGIHAIAAAPQNKQSMMLAPGYKQVHPMVLDIMGLREDHKRMVMLGDFRIVGVTSHVPLRRVAEQVTKQAVFETIVMAHEAVKSMGILYPRVGVSALNPHAGEGGLVGREEIDEIEPAILQAQQRGINAQGPIPGDTVFARGRAGEFDVVVAMFHDLTTGPLKLLAFGQGISMALGLPFPSAMTLHGTGFDIAWQGRANPQSMIDIIDAVASMAQNRVAL